jgi:hypothetical protein
MSEKAGDSTMKWVYDELSTTWNLMDNSSVIAKIFIKKKENSACPFRTKTLIASVYTGAATFSRLTRKNKEWKVYDKKFHTREEMELYLDIKKHSVQKMLETI